MLAVTTVFKIKGNKPSSLHQTCHLWQLWECGKWDCTSSQEAEGKGGLQVIWPTWNKIRTGNAALGKETIRWENGISVPHFLLYWDHHWFHLILENMSTNSFNNSSPKTLLQPNTSYWQEGLFPWYSVSVFPACWIWSSFQAITFYFPKMLYFGYFCGERWLGGC